MDENCGGRLYIFQQDGVSIHTSHLIQNWFSDNVDMFRFKKFWLINSPDLNPLDYYVRSIVELLFIFEVTCYETSYTIFYLYFLILQLNFHKTAKHLKVHDKSIDMKQS